MTDPPRCKAGVLEVPIGDYPATLLAVMPPVSNHMGALGHFIEVHRPQQGGSCVLTLMIHKLAN